MPPQPLQADLRTHSHRQANLAYGSACIAHSKQQPGTDVADGRRADHGLSCHVQL